MGVRVVADCRLGRDAGVLTSLARAVGPPGLSVYDLPQGALNPGAPARVTSHGSTSSWGRVWSVELMMGARVLGELDILSGPTKSVGENLGSATGGQAALVF